MWEISKNSRLLNRTRVKLINAYTASGYATLLCLVVSSLNNTELIMTKKELKEWSRICVLKVTGFSIHSNIDLQNK